MQIKRSQLLLCIAIYALFIFYFSTVCLPTIIDEPLSNLNETIAKFSINKEDFDEAYLLSKSLARSENYMIRNFQFDAGKTRSRNGPVIPSYDYNIAIKVINYFSVFV